MDEDLLGPALLHWNSKRHRRTLSTFAALQIKMACRLCTQIICALQSTEDFRLVVLCLLCRCKLLCRKYKIILNHLNMLLSLA